MDVVLLRDGSAKAKVAHLEDGQERMVGINTRVTDKDCLFNDPGRQLSKDRGQFAGWGSLLTVTGINVEVDELPLLSLVVDFLHEGRLHSVVEMAVLGGCERHRGAGLDDCQEQKVSKC
jgi:hypothetical protein